MTTYTVKRGDTAPRPRTQLLDGKGVAVNLAGATVRFRAFTEPGATAKIDQVATVVDAATGVVEYPLVAGDTDTPEQYLAEWQVTFGGGAVETFPGDGYDVLLVNADLDTAEEQGTGYCSVAQARAVGAQGSNAAVQAAIAEAEGRVDRFTRATWGVRTRTVVVYVDGSGRAQLPERIDTTQPVTVRAVGATTDLAATAYQLTSSSTPGQLDALYLGAGLSDPLVVGAEPWAGGWWGLLRGTRQLQVTGSFGTAVPHDVARATAEVAATITADAPTDGGAVAGLDADDEGNAVTITPAAEPGADGTRSTGSATADALLEPLVRRRVLVS